MLRLIHDSVVVFENLFHKFEFFYYRDSLDDVASFCILMPHQRLVLWFLSFGNDVIYSSQRCLT